jgi:hypothetical protein
MGQRKHEWGIRHCLEGEESSFAVFLAARPLSEKLSPSYNISFHSQYSTQHKTEGMALALRLTEVLLYALPLMDR